MKFYKYINEANVEKGQATKEKKETYWWQGN